MKVIKKALSLLLALTFVFGTDMALAQGTIGTRVSAADVADTGTYGDFSYALVNEYTQIQITKYNGTAAEVVIPDKIEGKDVTQIAGSVFSGKTAIESVTFPETVETIGNYAFYECPKLTAVTLPENLKTVGSYAFYNCDALKTLTISDSNASIGQYAFYSCNALETVGFGAGLQTVGYRAFEGCNKLTEVVLPDSLTTIGERAFYACSAVEKLDLGKGVTTIGANAFCGCSKLGEVKIPDSATAVNNYAFQNCTGLKNVTIGSGANINWTVFSGDTAIQSFTVSEDNEYVCSVDGVLLNKAKTSIIMYPKGREGGFVIPDTVEAVSDSAFASAVGLTEITIGSGVKTVGDSAFSGCSNLASAVFKDGGVTSIGQYAFYNCDKLTSVTLNSGLESIGYEAFYDCDGLEYIAIPDSVKTIANDVFRYCGALVTVQFGSGLETIGNYAFYECPKLTAVTLPENLKTVGSYAFYNCDALKTLTISDSNASIGQYAFYSCNALETVGFGAGLQTVGYRAFEGCNKLTEVVLPDSLTTIGERAFYACSAVEKLDLGKGVTTIGANAFCGCSKLGEVKIPDSATAVNNYAFQNCTGLKNVTIGSGANINWTVFSGDTAIQSFTVSEDNEYVCSVDGVLLNKAKTSIIMYPKGREGGFVIPDTVEAVSDSAFASAVGLTEITIGSGVKTVGDSAFSGCSNLASAVFKDGGVTSIGQYAFYNCDKLTSVTLNSGLESIGYEAFYDCDGLEYIAIPDSVKTIANDVFRYCGALVTVQFGSGLETIGNYAFYECPKLTAVTLPENLKTVGSYAFYNCDALKTLTISDSNASIGQYAFYSCNALETVGFGAGLQTVGYRAFEGCNKLTEVVLPDSLTTIGERAFYACSAVEKLDLGKGVTTIGANAFCGCSKLGEVKIPDSATAVNNYAFQNCTGLKNVTIGSGANINWTVFSGDTAIQSFTVSEDNEYVCSVDGVLLDKAKTAIIMYPKGREGGFVIPDTVEAVSDSAFASAVGLTEITIGSGVKTVGDSAFSGCSNLASAVFKDGGVTSIGQYAFYNCDKLASVTLNSGLESIGYEAFYDCDGLEYIAIPDSVKTIANDVFRYCGALVTVQFGSGLETIGNYAFYECPKLTAVTLPENLKTVGSYAFYNCDALKTLTISDSNASIGQYAFYSCNALETVGFGAGLQTVGYRAFEGCNKLTEVVLPDSLTTIGERAFLYCSALKKIQFGTGLTTVGSNAFPLDITADIYCYEDTYGNTYAKNFTNSTIHFIPTVFSVEDTRVSSLASSSVTLSWTKPGGFSNIGSYIVYRDGVKIGTTEETKFSDSGLTEGKTYVYKVLAKDNDGNISDGAEVEVVPKCSAVQSVSVANGAEEIGGAKAYRLTAFMENSLGFNGGTGCFYYSADKYTWTKIADARPLGNQTDYEADWNLTDLTTGTYYVRFVFTDKDGKTKESSTSVNVDRTAPDSIYGFAAFANVTNIQLSWAISTEIDTEIYRIYRKAEGEEAFKLITEIRNRETLSYTDKNVAENVMYKYYIVGVDKYAQEGTPTEQITIKLSNDEDKPRITKMTPAIGATIGGMTAFTVTATDNVGVVKIELYYSQDEENWVLFDSVDGASFSKQVDTTKLPNGKISFKAVAYDKNENASDGTPVYTIKVDNIAPEKVTGVKCKAVTATSITIEWNDVAAEDFSYFALESKDLQSGEFKRINTVYSTMGANVLGLVPNTEYTFRVAAYDKVGNRGEVSDEIVIKTMPDTTAPVINSIQPAPYSFNKSIPLSIRAWDDSAVASVKIQMSTDLKTWHDIYTNTLSTPQKTPVTNYTLDLVPYQEGKYYIRAIATDAAGNVSDSSDKAPYCEYEVDKTAPSTPSTLKTVSQNGVIEIRWESENEDCASFALYRSESEDGEYKLLSDGIKALNYFDRSIEPDITYYYKLQAKDRAGNVSGISAPVSAKMQNDTQLPVILSISPADKSVIGTAYNTVNVLAQDNNRLDTITVSYKTDGDFIQLVEAKGINESSRIVSGKIPLDSLTDATVVTVTAQATDIFGNKSEIKTVSYTVDKKAPTVKELKAAGIEGGIKLTWLGGAEADVIGYKIYRREATENNYALIGQRAASGTEYTFTDANVSELMSYYYRVEAIDAVGNTYYAETDKVNSGLVEIIGKGAPKAVLEVPAVCEVGVEYWFDASKSSDEGKIAAYTIDFGDGAASNEAKCYHKYTDVGTYTVTLTVTDDDGNKNSTSKEVIVTERRAIGEVKVTVVNSNGAALPNMPVYFDLGGDKQSIVYTQSNGTASFNAVIGRYTIGTYADGYLPVKQEVVITSGTVTQVKLVVVQQPIVTGEFEIHRMTLAEIIAAGIDVTAPENQNVIKFTGYLYYGKESVPFTFTANDSGVIDTTPVIHDFGDGTGAHSLTPYVVGGGSGGWGGGSGGYSEPIVVVVDIPMEASFLKDFFDVKLHIMNHAAEEYSLLNNVVTLNVPDGLTLMKTNTTSSNASVRIPEIKGQQTHTVNWILRGDVPGSYEISADFTGTVSQFNAPVQARFVADDPIQVRDGSGLSMMLDASKTLYNNASYFDFGLRNDSREDTYMPDVNVEGAVLRYMQLEDANGVRRTITEIPQTLEIGQTLWKRYYKYAEVEAPEDAVLIGTCGMIAEKFGAKFTFTAYPISYFFEETDIEPDPDTYCIKVVDDSTGTGIADAFVQTDKGSGKTDNRGILILNLPENNCVASLKVTKNGYEAYENSGIILPPDRIHTVRLKKESTADDDFFITMSYCSPYSIVNGEKVNNMQYGENYAQMLLVLGKSFVPLRHICELAGWQVDWSDADMAITITDPKTGEKICMNVGQSAAAKYDGEGNLVQKFNMDISPILIRGITMVPLRQIVECFGYYVGYSEQSYGAYVVISSTDRTSEVDALCKEAYDAGIIQK